MADRLEPREKEDSIRKTVYVLREGLQKLKFSTEKFVIKKKLFFYSIFIIEKMIFRSFFF